MKKYLIWSNEHNAWWRPNSRGYCADIRDAGQYTMREAENICANAYPRIKNEPPPEVMIDKDEVLFNAKDATETDINEVEIAVGIGCNAWDTIDPKEIIAAAWNRKPASKTSL